ncbi:MAG: GDSL-type esterase/lipase family protein [Planctomycetota bacterium]|nr:GDSL-type esterase/lipase family protein [Planctomycetota bacterium]
MHTLVLLALALLSPSAVHPLAQAAAPTQQPSSVVPVPRTDEGILPRQEECLKRARETASAKVVFVGDSITQGWEGAGARVWKEALEPLGALDLGVSGDRTEHVLWRLGQAPLTRLQPKAIVLLIGTNNLGHGSSDAAQTLLGIQRVVAVLREQCPAARLLVLDVFPRGERFNAMRGDIAQINQVLAGMDDGKLVRCLRVGDRFVEEDGSIRKEIMPDFLHLSETGYRMWADALVPHLREALAEKH